MLDIESWVNLCIISCVLKKRTFVSAHEMEIILGIV